MNLVLAIALLSLDLCLFARRFELVRRTKSSLL
jgi:hypothetical protein